MKTNYKEKYFDLKKRHKRMELMTIDLHFICMLAAARDEYGFSHERLRRLTNRYKLKLECIRSKNVTLEDIYTDLCNDLGKEFVDKIMETKRLEKED